MNLLEKIKSKPEEDRRKILIITVAILMTVVVYVWITNLKLPLSEGENALSTKEETSDNKFSPYEIFTSKISNISEAFANIFTNFELEKKEIFKRTDNF